jgi:hypothetical protein
MTAIREENSSGFGLIQLRTVYNFCIIDKRVARVESVRIKLQNTIGFLRGKSPTAKDGERKFCFYREEDEVRKTTFELRKLYSGGKYQISMNRSNRYRTEQTRYTMNRIRVLSRLMCGGTDGVVRQFILFFLLLHRRENCYILLMGGGVGLFEMLCYCGNTVRQHDITNIR